MAGAQSYFETVQTFHMYQTKQIRTAVICFFLFIMEDIDCQSEQLIAPNKLQMFCMHSCSIYLFMCINFKKKAVKNVSVLALSLQSFICLHAVQCRFCIFFPSVFSRFFFPADSAAGMKAASGSGVAQCFRWPLCFFFSSFLVLLKHICTTVEKVLCSCATPTRPSTVKNGQKWQMGLWDGF